MYYASYHDFHYFRIKNLPYGPCPIVIQSLFFLPAIPCEIFRLGSFKFIDLT